MAEAREVVIVDACRTPIGRAGDRGVFRSIAYTDLMVPVLQAVLERNSLDPSIIDEVVIGSAITIGACATRDILLTAGYPEVVAGSDTARQCASSSNAIANAARTIVNGDADVVIAGGLETQGRKAPVSPAQIGNRGADDFSSLYAGAGSGKGPEYPEGWKIAKLWPMMRPDLPTWIYDMGATAEELSQRFGISREDSDAFALTSHQKAIAAQDAGIFKDEIIPITINYTDGTSEVIDTDQCPRRSTSLEKIKSVPPAFRENGLVTAANSCPQNDGAGAVLMMSKEKAKELGYKPLCTFRNSVAIGCDPTVMGIGPAPSTWKLLNRTGMKISDFDIVEINEAFACQVVYSMRNLGMSDEQQADVNPYGGAIAIGHPLGATGVRQAGVIAHGLRRRDQQWGLATLCVGGGQGMATSFEREASY